jgi:hypothetical protein
MYVWLVNQAAREFQLWCRHESDFRAVSANSDSNHPKFSKQNDTDGSMSIKQGHCSVKKGKQWRIEQVSIPSKWSTCTAMVLDAPGLKNCLAGAQSRALGVPGRPGTQPKPSHWNLGTMAQLLYSASHLLYFTTPMTLFYTLCIVVLRKIGWLEAEFGETARKFPFLARHCCLIILWILNWFCTYFFLVLLRRWHSS